MNLHLSRCARLIFLNFSSLTVLRNSFFDLFESLISSGQAMHWGWWASLPLEIIKHTLLINLLFDWVNIIEFTNILFHWFLSNYSIFLVVVIWEWSLTIIRLQDEWVVPRLWFWINIGLYGIHRLMTVVSLTLSLGLTRCLLWKIGWPFVSAYLSVLMLRNIVL